MPDVLLTKEILEKGLKLETARRDPPLDEKGYSKNFDKATKAYQEWLYRYGYLLITDAIKNLEAKQPKPIPPPDKGRLSDHPCGKCKAMDVWVVGFECDGHEDYRITCNSCGHSYCVDGDDG